MRRPSALNSHVGAALSTASSKIVSGVNCRVLGLALAGLVGGLGCMPDPPKPQKATDLESIEPKKSEEGSAEKPLPSIPTGYVAKVNGKQIKTATFRKVYDLKLKKYRIEGKEIPKSADRRYRKSITERLIYQEVVRQEAEQLGVEYDKAVLATREETQRKGIKDWGKHLKRRGESDDSLREMIVRELREKAIMAKMGSVNVSEEDIKAEYERIKGNYASDKTRIKASHILCKVGPETRPAGKDGPKEPSKKQLAAWDAKALEKCTTLRKKLTEGDPKPDFAQVAREASEGPSAKNGGDLGIFEADRMVDAFSKVAFGLAEGEISKPVKTEFGYHVIVLHAKYPAGPLPMAALEGKIRERLSSRSVVKGRHELKDKLLARYDIENRMLARLGDDKATTRGLKKYRKNGKNKKGGKAEKSAQGGKKDAHGDKK